MGLWYLSQDESEALVEELSEALEELVDSSGCLDMLPLWLAATSRPRKHLRDDTLKAPPVPEHIRAMKKSMRSKYASLAAWRHAICWQRPEMSEAAHRKAMHDIYFTPYESNRPPYAWSGASSRAPAAGEYSSTSQLDSFARRGCWESIEELRRIRNQLQHERTDLGELQAEFVESGLKKSLKDVLRLERLWQDWDEDEWED